MFIESKSKLPAKLSCLVSFSIPGFLGVYWPVTGLGFDWVSGAVRAGLLLCVGVLAVLWWGAPTTRRERQWAGILGSYLALLMIPTLFAAEVDRAGKNWIRIVFLLAFCLVLARAFRHPATRRAFGIGALLVSLLLTVYIIGCYVSFVGLVAPTYESTRIFKESVLLSLGVGLNPLAFSCSFSGILAACVLPPSRLLNAALAMVVGISTAFTGSRTPVALMAASVLFVIVSELLRRRAALRRISLGLLLAALLGVAVFQSNTGLDMRRWSAITEGRVDLWTVAWQKFLEKPLTGYGADSWGDDLISRMPDHYQISSGLISGHVGGYHNTYITLLAEEGAVVFTFALFLLWRGFRTIEESIRPEAGQRWQRRTYLFAFVFLACRGFIEVPGIFGYGQDPAEFAAYTLLALMISLEAAPQTRDKVTASVEFRRLKKLQSNPVYSMSSIR